MFISIKWYLLETFYVVFMHALKLTRWTKCIIFTLFTMKDMFGKPWATTVTEHWGIIIVSLWIIFWWCQCFMSSQQSVQMSKSVHTVNTYQIFPSIPPLHTVHFNKPSSSISLGKILSSLICLHARSIFTGTAPALLRSWSILTSCLLVTRA